MKFGELSKHTASKYAALSPKEKDVWLKKAAAEKARFDLEIKNYQPPAGYNEKGDAIRNHPRHAPPTPSCGRKPGKRKPQVPRDPNAPKRNSSAFLLYQNCYRVSLLSTSCLFLCMTYLGASSHNRHHYSTYTNIGEIQGVKPRYHLWSAFKVLITHVQVFTCGGETTLGGLCCTG